MTQKTVAAESGGIPGGPAARKNLGMMMNSSEPNRSSFPSLPIINNPQAPARSQREKYGTLFYLGILGLIVLVTLVGWFGYRVWSLRDIWAKVYVLIDAREPEALRIQAAFSLGHDPRVEQKQLWDLSLRRGIPEFARDILAEGIGAELLAEDPQGYVTAVARSPDWPDWLRLALARPTAYAATCDLSRASRRAPPARGSRASPLGSLRPGGPAPARSPDRGRDRARRKVLGAGAGTFPAAPRRDSRRYGSPSRDPRPGHALETRTPPGHRPPLARLDGP